MADPVMSDLPLRRVLESVTREYRSRAELFTAYAYRHPLEAWIHFSAEMRRKVFKERREQEFDTLLSTLVRCGYVQEHGPSRTHPENQHTRLGHPSMFYRLTEMGKSALRSVKRPS